MKPDAYYKSVYEIDYKYLKDNNIKNIFFDVDNTLVPYDKNKPSDKCIKLIVDLKKDFNVYLLSNSRSKRILSIASIFHIDGYYSSMKPLRKNYKKILNKYKPNECIFVGDQFMTDVWGAKRNNLKVILVDSLGSPEPITTKFWRFFERRVINKLERESKFKPYNYYNEIK